MKIIKWILIACRVLPASLSLTLFASGCGDQSGPIESSHTTEEANRDAESRKAMEAASAAPKKK
jgi:hypothetical protein